LAPLHAAGVAAEAASTKLPSCLGSATLLHRPVQLLLLLLLLLLWRPCCSCV
jgi:hypothetical protein